MKNTYLKFVLLVSIPFMLSFVSVSNIDLKGSNQQPDYEVSKVYPYITVTKAKLNAANTLIDLNPHYKPSWVKKYLKVEVKAIQNGTIKTAIHNSNQLHPTQKRLMKIADVGTAISIKISYIPENTLKDNPAREMEFSFTVEPDKDATYIGGQEQLKNYLKRHIMNKIPNNLFEGYKLAAVKFSIDEKGKIIRPEIASSSENQAVDKILLAAIENMPNWKPASYANGLKVKQDYALMVGNMESCVVHTLNVNPR